MQSKMQTKKTCRGYSIWMIPKNSAYSTLSSIIARISKEHNTPIFRPHITLIGEIKGDETDLAAKTEQLASQISPFTVIPLQINLHNKYYRSLYLKLKETKELIEANQKAQEIFNKKENFFPHLSLMYGNIPTLKKLDIISNLEKINNDISINALYFYSTKGGIENWHEIKKFNLKCQ